MLICHVYDVKPGVLAQYSHVAGGVCFRCGGSGIDPNELKLNKSKRRIEKVKIVNGRKIVLEPKYDLQGRFSHYSVYVEGKYEATYKNIKMQIMRLESS